MSDRPTHGFGFAQSNQVQVKTDFSLPKSNESHGNDSPVDIHRQQTTLLTIPSASEKSTSFQQPLTPVGKVVEAGQEHTGRWTKEEHEAFLAGLQQYGKEWKKVAAKVRTRTVVQTRTHAQKYFQKVQKGSTGEDIDIDLGIFESKKTATGKKRSSRQKQPKQNSQEYLTPILPITSSKQVAAMNNQAAAQLMAISKIKTQPEGSITNVNKPPLSSYFTSSSDQVSKNSYDRNSGLFHMQKKHSQPQIRYNTLSGGNFGQVSFTAPLPQNMKIFAPNPDETLKKNMFPEPSPAACGSRKVIELAAAKMLAAVGNNSGKILEDFSGKATPPVSSYGPKEDIIRTNENPIAQNNLKRPAVGKLQIVKPESLGVNFNGNKRRNVEPVTPWDGQLEVLESEVKIKGSEQNNLLVTKTVNKNADGSISNDDDEIQHPYHPLYPSTNCVRSALHKAVCEGSLQQVKLVLNNQESNNGEISEEQLKKLKMLNDFDGDGFSPIHSAVSLIPSNMAVVMTHLLLSFGTDATSVDQFGNSSLHWAARAGNDEVAQILMFKKCSPDLQNNEGETPLHWAMRAGIAGLGVVRVLLENGARASLLNQRFQHPLDLAADGFEDVVEDEKEIDSENNLDSVEDAIDAKRQCRMNFLCCSPQSRTLVLHHPECLEHVPKSKSDWEVPDRVNAIMNAISSGAREYEVQLSSNFEKASLELLSRVHSAEYLTFVNNLSKELEKRIEDLENVGATKKVAPVVPFTPMVQRTMGKDIDVKKGSQSDTSFSSGSLRAARRAAGAVQHAVDCVLVGRNRNAFCVVRPPGHHAGINGLLAGGESCGFCIFNNVAAAAMHALSDEGNRPKCQRCAIVDIDAHHGNGTEEIVKRCDDPSRLFFFSVHLYDNDKQSEKQNGFKFYPGTGEDDDIAHNIVNVPIAPMWREKELIQLTRSSPSGMIEGRNTRNRSKLRAAASKNNITGSDTQIMESPTPPPHYYQGTGRQAYRRAIQQRLIPALRAFNPDLIIISIGFDASKGDVGNARHYFSGKESEGINLEPEDYAWTTSKIMEVADICCEGRVVSVLEGGYGRTQTNDTENNNQEHLLDKSIFSECAVRHLRAMIDPNDKEKWY